MLKWFSPGRRHFEYYQGVDASHKRTGYLGHGVSILMTNYGYAKIIGKTKKLGFCIVFILWLSYRVQSDWAAEFRVT
jgi:hypothetical protein